MKKIFLFFMGLLAALTLQAEQVSYLQALQKACQFMPDRQFGQARNQARGAKPRDMEPIYIFNAEGHKGYVIVSGDDRTRPILGYAEEGSFDEDKMPENMKWWLDNLVCQIKALDTSLNNPAVVSATRSSMAAISPLIQTTWNQNAPYNNMCPDGDMRDKDDDGYDADNLCVTGCVATAMAQVMYYWKWPKECPALDAYPVGYYDDNWNFVETHIVKGLPATTFKWNKMNLRYYSNETGEAVDAVAELMRYCGQTVHMQYGVGSSGAGLSPSTLIEKFNYSKNTRWLYRENYTTPQWEALVYEELKANRPVLYMGRTASNSAHQFIVDGYDGDGLFHFNWGWGYSGNYSVLSLADPYRVHGIGSSSTHGAFQYYQAALVGVKPTEEGEVMVPVLYSSLDQFQEKTYTRSNVETDFANVILNGTVSSEYTVTPESDFHLQVGWGLYKDDQFVSCLSSQSQTIPSLQNSYYIPNNKTISFGADLAAGKYQIFQIYRFPDSETWRRCENYTMNSIVAEVTATQLTVRRPDLSIASFIVNSITTSDEPEAGSSMDFAVNVTNTGETSKVVINLWLQKSGTSTWDNVAQGEYRVDPWETTNITMVYTPTEAGTYNLKATGSSEEVLCTTTISIAATETIIIDGLQYLCTPLYQRAKVVRNENADKFATSISIRQTVTASGVNCHVKAIADNALSNFSSVSKIEIPEGIETVGKEALRNLWGLKKLILPSTLKHIDDKSFFNLPNLEDVVSHIINPCVISGEVFLRNRMGDEGCGFYLTPATLYVPFNTKSKYEEAGWTAQFANVEEGDLKEAFDGVLKYSYSTGSDVATVIQDDSYMSLTEVAIPVTVSFDDKIYHVTAIGSLAFEGCSNLNTLTLPEGLVSIGNNSFDCTGVGEIIFPTTLKSIGDEAFSFCIRIRAINLPEGLLSIGVSAFYGSPELRKVILPSSLKSIGESAFNNCENLEAVVSHIVSPCVLPDNVFNLSVWNSQKQESEILPSSATLYVPFDTQSRYEAAGWTAQFAKVEEGDLKEAFDGVLKYSYSTGSKEAVVIPDESYKSLTEVAIPATVSFGGKSYHVTAIGECAFDQCGNLRTLTLSEGLVSIDKCSFRGTYIKDIVFPTTLKSIGDWAFVWCDRIRAINLPEGLLSIGEFAFSGLQNLRKVILPSSVRSIGGWAFSSENLETVVSHIASPCVLPDNVFKHSVWNDQKQESDIYPSSATLYIPFGTLSRYETAGWTAQFAAIEEMKVLGPGDANGDGFVDSDDLAAISRYILKGDYDGFFFKNADMNNDGKVNVVDLVIVNKVLHP